ncbi:MAG TPA: hypothetical protein PKJ69_00055 [Spirochaetota bacterium]|nr:hypothetical protein [Spirochaetota bacterium]HQL44393.1 hypothetical protein [Spirochaetota bacterium]
MNTKKYINITILLGMIALGSLQVFGSDVTISNVRPNLMNIRTTNGKFYAYIVLLFNENPHFVNLIQADSIPVRLMQTPGFNIMQYEAYLKTLQDSLLKTLAQQILRVYKEPDKISDNELEQLTQKLENRNIILRFSKTKDGGEYKYLLDYCIYGKRKPVTINHPLFNVKVRIFNIQPLIYYDEFSTSNSTFYFDMIYINPDEVYNDYIISKRIMDNKSCENMFFVGAHVNEDIRFCIKKSFSSKETIFDEIWKMFEIHELTHKILNNYYYFFDQVTGEELALSSTIYYNTYLGLAILYSYLDYNTINPHRIAASNYIKFLSLYTANGEYIEKPSLIKNLPIEDIKKIARLHFETTIKNLK